MIGLRRLARRRDRRPLGVEGARLEHRRWGPRRGRTLVLLHEGLGSVSTWRDLPERLVDATGLGVFAYSRAGYGRSSSVRLPRPPSYLADEAALLPRVLAGAGIDRSIWIGHSDGASIAAIAAAAVPAAAKPVAPPDGLVLVAPHFFVEPESLEGIRQARRAFEEGDLRARLARHHGENVDVAFRGWCDAWLDPGFRSWDIRSLLPRIDRPMLVVQGTRDPYGTLRQVRTAEAEAGGPVEVLALEGVGHVPHRETPDRLVRAIADFVRRLGPGGGGFERGP